MVELPLLLLVDIEFLIMKTQYVHIHIIDKMMVKIKYGKHDLIGWKVLQSPVDQNG